MNSIRYSRQTVLPEITQTGQKRLSRARVLCIGVGGLGSPVALYLAAAGVGTIGLIDSDTVDLSNLQRQILFATSDQGMSKVSSAKTHLLQLNPEIVVETHHERFTIDNAERLANQYDLLIDGSDNFSTKFLANDVAFKRGIPMVYGAVNHFEGQVALFWGNRGSCYRCLYPAPPKEHVQNCAEAGVLGAVVGTIGTLQATLALQYLISGGEKSHPLCPEVGNLTLFELTGKWNIRTVQVTKNPNCPTCSRTSAEIKLQQGAESSCATTAVITYETFTKMRKESTLPTLLLDVRETDEWAAGHISNAVHWPLDRIERGEFPIEITTTQIVVTYCRSGVRSKRAAQLLSETGIKSVYSLAGGIESWPERLV